MFKVIGTHFKHLLTYILFSLNKIHILVANKNSVLLNNQHPLYMKTMCMEGPNIFVYVKQGRKEATIVYLLIQKFVAMLLL